MPQFGRPSADTNNAGLYTNQAGGSTNIYQSIDETVADDADFIQSPLDPSTAAYTTALSSITDPSSSTGHVMRTRYRKDTAAGAQINIVAQLRQAYVSEASLGTLIVARTFTDVTGTFTTDAYTLTGAEADAITNYASLFYRYTSDQV